MLRQDDRAGACVDANGAGAEIRQQLQLRAPQASRLGGAAEPRSVERRQQPARWLIGNVPQTDDELRRAGVDERSRESRDAVAGHTPAA